MGPFSAELNSVRANLHTDERRRDCLDSLEPENYQKTEFIRAVFISVECVVPGVTAVQPANSFRSSTMDDGSANRNVENQLKLGARTIAVVVTIELRRKIGV